MSCDGPVFDQGFLRKVYKQDSETQKIEETETKWPLTPEDNYNMEKQKKNKNWKKKQKKKNKKKKTKLKEKKKKKKKK